MGPFQSQVPCPRSVAKLLRPAGKQSTVEVTTEESVPPRRTHPDPVRLQIHRHLQSLLCWWYTEVHSGHFPSPEGLRKEKHVSRHLMPSVSQLPSSIIFLNHLSNFILRTLGWGCQSPWNCSSIQVWVARWVLGLEPGSSGRVASALYCWTVSLTPSSLIINLSNYFMKYATFLYYTLRSFAS